MCAVTNRDHQDLPGGTSFYATSDNMILLLSVLGGAAVLEIRKLVSRDKHIQDLRDLRKKEAILQRLLKVLLCLLRPAVPMNHTLPSFGTPEQNNSLVPQDTEKDLLVERQEREKEQATVVELREAASGIHRQKEELQRKAEALQEENAEWVQKATSLLENHTEVSRCAESLRMQNEDLSQEARPPFGSVAGVIYVGGITRAFKSGNWKRAGYHRVAIPKDRIVMPLSNRQSTLHNTKAL